MVSKALSYVQWQRSRDYKNSPFAYWPANTIWTISAQNSVNIACLDDLHALHGSEVNKMYQDWSYKGAKVTWQSSEVLWYQFPLINLFYGRSWNQCKARCGTVYHRSPSSVMRFHEFLIFWKVQMSKFPILLFCGLFHVSICSIQTDFRKKIVFSSVIMLARESLSCVGDHFWAHQMKEESQGFLLSY